MSTKSLDSSDDELNVLSAEDMTENSCMYLHCYYCTISFNSAGPVTRDGPAEIFVSAPPQSCRDMPKKIRQFSAAGEEKFLYLVHVTG